MVQKDGERQGAQKYGKGHNPEPGEAAIALPLT